MPKTTEQNLIVSSGKSKAAVTNNRCIGDDTKAAARRSPNYIRKTKKYVMWNAGIYPITEIL